MVGIALILIVFALAGTAILTYMGYGLASLLLPREWKSDRGLLAPLLGYAFLLLVGYYAVSTVLNLQHALRITLILATVLNVVALWRHKGERLTIRLGETGWAWLLAALVFLVSVLPLLHYGYATTIGENWDPEDYLPVADYLVQVPVKDIATMPPNPLRDLNADPPRIGLTLGFSIVQGALQQLVGWDALRSFAPTMALLRGLAVLAFYLLFRRTLRMPQMPALLATLLAGANALALWIAFFNFGMQASAMVLVPLELVLLASVLRQPSWRGVLAAGLAAAGLPIAYCPALTALVPMAAALGLYELIAARKRWPVLAAGLATAGASPLLAGGTVLNYWHGFAARYAQQKTTLLTHFVPWSDILGFSPFSLRPEAARPLLAGLQTAALALIVLLALVALVRNRDRALWLAVVLPGLLYLAWLRGWIGQAVLFLQQHRILPALGEGVVSRLQPYPYAYLKGAAFVAPVLLGLGVQGFWEFKSWGEKGRAARVSRILAIFPAAFLLVLTGWSADRIVARYWARPARFDREALRIEEAIALLPKGAPVYLTGRTERGRPLLGLAAYLLREHPLSGRLSTGYAALDHRLPGDAPPYALLDADDNPLPLGFFPEEHLWAGAGMVLYRRDPSVLSFLDLRADAYANRPAGEIHIQEPLAQRLLVAYGAYPPLSGEQPLVLHADAERVSRSDDLAGTPGTRSLLLALASLEPVTITLNWSDGSSEQAVLPAGVSTYRSQAYPVPIRVEVAAEEGAAAWACWAALLGEGKEAGAQPQQVLLVPEATADGTALEVNLAVYNPAGRPLRLSLEVWENSFEGARHYAWWGPLALPERGQVSLRADLSQREARAWIGKQETPFSPHPGAESWPAVADGSYFAALWVYYGAHVVEIVPVGQFRLEAGQVQGLGPIPLSPYLLWPHSPAESSGARFGPSIEPSGYERGTGPFPPGESVPLALEWHTLAGLPTDYSVTVQIVGRGRLWGQWDGPIGQWYPGTAWKPEQYIRDDIPLQAAADAPRGHYRLIVAVSDPATMQRLPVYSPAGESLGDALDLGEIVVR